MCIVGRFLHQSNGACSLESYFLGRERGLHACYLGDIYYLVPMVTCSRYLPGFLRLGVIVVKCFVLFYFSRYKYMLQCYTADTAAQSLEFTSASWLFTCLWVVYMKVLILFFSCLPVCSRAGHDPLCWLHGPVWEFFKKIIVFTTTFSTSSTHWHKP